tara:strand:+ start:72266 stop:72463 length:198 start_codon:yes stop_codon:yes gene_type:complete
MSFPLFLTVNITPDDIPEPVNTPANLKYRTVSFQTKKSAENPDADTPTHFHSIISRTFIFYFSTG